MVLRMFSYEDGILFLNLKHHLSSIQNILFLYNKYLLFKILSKYIHVGSCFEGFIIRNTMVQSKFNLNVYFVNYRFFKFVANHNITVLFYYTCMH